MATFDSLPDLRAAHSATRPLAPETLVIVNAGAGRTRLWPGARKALVARLHALPGLRSVVHTEREGDALAAAERALADGYGRIVVAGGDGTLNDVIQVLARTPIELGIIPAGTTNVLAHELGIPADPLAAVALVERGHARQIDLGRANGRYFAMMIGLGVDGQVAHHLRPETKARFGNLAYWEAGWRTFKEHRAWRLKAELDPDTPQARKLRGLASLLVASNTRLYGGRWMKLNEQADVADGQLDLFWSHAPHRWRALAHFLAIALGQTHRCADVERLRCRTLRLVTSRPVPYQLDGDAAGHTPVTIELVAGALRVLAPGGRGLLAP